MLPVKLSIRKGLFKKTLAQNILSDHLPDPNVPMFLFFFNYSESEVENLKFLVTCKTHSKKSGPAQTGAVRKAKNYFQGAIQFQKKCISNKQSPYKKGVYNFLCKKIFSRKLLQVHHSIIFCYPKKISLVG